MPMISFSGIIMSCATFWQNIGISISFPEVPVPDSIKRIFTILQNFYNDILFNLIPKIPKFDKRAQLVILSLGLTIVLDVAIMWFVNPVWQTFIHLGDMVAFGVLGYFMTTGLMLSFDTVSYIAIGVSVAWLLVRLFFKMKEYCGRENNLSNIADDLTRYYLNGIVPGVEKVDDLDVVNQRLQRYSGLIELIPQKPPCWILFLQFLFGCLFIVAGLWFSNVYQIPGITLPPIVAMFGQYICYIVGSFMLILFFLKLCECSRKVLFKIKKFIKRWGLRLLMLALDLLYIPILTSFVTQVTPVRTGCDRGYMFHVNYGTGRWDYLENHSHVCIPCGHTIEDNFNGYMDALINNTLPKFVEEHPNITNFTLGFVNSSLNYDYPVMGDDAIFCNNMCYAGKTLLMLEADSSLYWIKEVLQVNGGSILFTILFIMFGIPFLYRSLIKSNSSIMKDMKVFGNDEREKWRNAAIRLHTTGIFLFAEFMSVNVFWSVGVLFYKFIVMLLTTLTMSVNPFILFALPAVYLIMFIVLCRRRPHMNKFNNVLDGILYFLNFLYSFVPILALNGIRIPAKYLIPFSFAILVIPFISIAYFVIVSMCAKPTDDDPTVIRKLSDEELAERAERIKANKRKRLGKRGKKGKKNKKNKKNQSDPFCLDDITESSDQPDAYAAPPGYPAYNYNGYNYNQYNANDQMMYNQYNANVQQNNPLSLNINKPVIQLQNLAEIDETDYLPEDYTTVTMEQIESINKFRHLSQEENKTFKVNKIVLAQRMTEMYDKFDLIIDGSTIGKLANFLTTAVLFSAGALGWFIAGMMIRYEQRVTAVCTRYLS